MRIKLVVRKGYFTWKLAGLLGLSWSVGRRERYIFFIFIYLFIWLHLKIVIFFRRILSYVHPESFHHSSLNSSWLWWGSRSGSCLYGTDLFHKIHALYGKEGDETEMWERKEVLLCCWGHERYISVYCWPERSIESQAVLLHSELEYIFFFSAEQPTPHINHHLSPLPRQQPPSLSFSSTTIRHYRHNQPLSMFYLYTNHHSSLPPYQLLTTILHALQNEAWFLLTCASTTITKLLPHHQQPSLTSSTATTFLHSLQY